ncbi:hypothetical protein H5410_002573 [Solanum commersonii]|uniref:Uncharacterized protein n=1 Tax=Solanum commersonii TaxID=4109 RepID=A0A9J6B2H4_SOLCO|nr:hypothetical protein H5410_002573 [Solanum commersonii]
MLPSHVSGRFLLCFLRNCYDFDLSKYDDVVVFVDENEERFPTKYLTSKNLLSGGLGRRFLGLPIDSALRFTSDAAARTNIRDIEYGKIFYLENIFFILNFSGRMSEFALAYDVQIRVVFCRVLILQLAGKGLAFIFEVESLGSRREIELVPMGMILFWTVRTRSIMFICLSNIVMLHQ